MFRKLITLSALFVSAYCLSIGTVSEQNAAKRDADAGDLFPDWVPFKNKHGDELGEFVQVEKRNKVKKRLAPPMNFLMRAVAEPESDDFYEKGGGEGDSEDYFEKKDWSDLHRPADEVSNKAVTINHTDISDIDGVVNILTKKPDDHILKAINEALYIQDNKTKKVERLGNIEKDRNNNNESESIEEDIITTQKSSTTQSTTLKKPENESFSNNEEETESDDDDENTPEQQQNKTEATSEEKKESEARKAKILSSVDELKERHAEEQRELSEKIKGDKMFNDEFERDKSSYVVPNRFNVDFTESDRRERRPNKKGRRPTPKPDYDEYEDFDKSSEDKYKINVQRKESEHPATIEPRRKTTANGREKTKRRESAKMTVFKNPRLFMIYDDSDETADESAALMNTASRGKQKFSSKFTATPSTNTDERISLLPVNSEEGEYTLSSKPKKNRRKKTKTTTGPITDSTVAETVTDNYKQTTAIDNTASGPDNTESESHETSTGPGTSDDVTSYETTAAETTGTEYTDTKGTDSVSKDSEAVTDAVPASSDHKKNEDYNNEKGGSREHKSEHFEEHEEHGEKAYEGKHKDTKAAKGHHDKENHLGKYDDHGGVDKHHSEESGHYGDHHHEEHGKKHAKYEESGKHSKGHSTKGSHDIHKKEEYEKKVEFFEEDGDSGEEEKHGGYNHEREHAEGGKFKSGDLKAGHHHQSKGEEGHFDKGSHHHVNKGHKQSNGHDSHGKHGQKHFHKDGKEGGKKWIYHHGHPAKTANLVVIDRRGDQFFHGQNYFG